MKNIPSRTYNGAKERGNYIKSHYKSLDGLMSLGDRYASGLMRVIDKAGELLERGLGGPMYSDRYLGELADKIKRYGVKDTSYDYNIDLNSEDWKELRDMPVCYYRNLADMVGGALYLAGTHYGSNKDFAYIARPDDGKRKVFGGKLTL